MVVTRPRAGRGEGDRLRGEILEAADELLVATGDEEAVSVRAVAREVGCTPPAIYLHFANRHDLLLAVCERYFADLDRRLRAAADGTHDAIQRLRDIGTAYVRWGVDNPEPYRMIFMSRRDEKAGADAFAHLVQDAQRAIDEGCIPPADALLVASGLWSVVHGMTSLAISMPDFPHVGLDALVAHVVDTYVAGLTAGGETG